MRWPSNFSLPARWLSALGALIGVYWTAMCEAVAGKAAALKMWYMAVRKPVANDTIFAGWKRESACFSLLVLVVLLHMGVPTIVREGSCRLYHHAQARSAEFQAVRPLAVPRRLLRPISLVVSSSTAANASPHTASLRPLPEALAPAPSMRIQLLADSAYMHLGKWASGFDGTLDTLCAADNIPGSLGFTAAATTSTFDVSETLLKVPMLPELRVLVVLLLSAAVLTFPATVVENVHGYQLTVGALLSVGVTLIASCKDINKGLHEWFPTRKKTVTACVAAAAVVYLVISFVFCCHFGQTAVEWSGALLAIARALSRACTTGSSHFPDECREAEVQALTKSQEAAVAKARECGQKMVEAQRRGDTYIAQWRAAAAALTAKTQEYAEQNDYFSDTVAAQAGTIATQDAIIQSFSHTSRILGTEVSNISRRITDMSAENESLSNALQEQCKQHRLLQAIHEASKREIFSLKRQLAAAKAS